MSLTILLSLKVTEDNSNLYRSAGPPNNDVPLKSELGSFKVIENGTIR